MNTYKQHHEETVSTNLSLVSDLHAKRLNGFVHMDRDWVARVLEVNVVIQHFEGDAVEG